MANKVIDVIQYENDGALIHKHYITDFNYGSQLIVHESQEAVFFRDGKIIATFESGRYTLETQNIEKIKKSVNSLADGNNIFHAEVYFINKAVQLGIKWGTDSKVRMFDPISGLHLELGACGTFNIKIEDGLKLLLKVVGTSVGIDAETLFARNDSFIGLFRGMVVNKVKSTLAKAIREKDINILEVDEHLDILSDLLKEQINQVLEDYGLLLPEFFITTILTPDDDVNFIRLKEQHAERYLKVQQQRIRKDEALAAQEVAVIEAETKSKATIIKAEGDANAAVIAGRAEAEIMKAKGYTYQDETARIIGRAVAENESGSGAGLASEVLKTGVGLGVGVHVAKTVAGTLSNIYDSDGSWECPNCKHKGNKGGFCEICGYSISSIWICKSCGQKNSIGNFCPNCGAKKEI